MFKLVMKYVTQRDQKIKSGTFQERVARFVPVATSLAVLHFLSRQPFARRKVPVEITQWNRVLRFRDTKIGPTSPPHVRRDPQGNRRQPNDDRGIQAGVPGGGQTFPGWLDDC